LPDLLDESRSGVVMVLMFALLLSFNNFQ
jgi:hypothetical protein